MAAFSSPRVRIDSDSARGRTALSQALGRADPPHRALAVPYLAKQHQTGFEFADER